MAGNHKHALDPILVDCCTTRTAHTLAKKDLHDGAFGWLFRGAGTIPVDHHAEHNPEALNEVTSDIRIAGMSYKQHYIDEIDNVEDYCRVSEEICRFDMTRARTNYPPALEL